MKEEEKKRGDELIRYRLALPDLQRIKWGNARDGATVRKHRIEKRNLKPMSLHLESVTGCRSISCASSSARSGERSAILALAKEA